MHLSIVDRDMVWKLGELQSAYNELRFDVETVVRKSFVFRLLIFKQHGWAIKTLPEFPDHILNDYDSKYSLIIINKENEMLLKLRQIEIENIFRLE